MYRSDNTDCQSLCHVDGVRYHFSGVFMCFLLGTLMKLHKCILVHDCFTPISYADDKTFFSSSVDSTREIEIIEQITAIDSLCYKNKLIVSKSAEGNFYMHESKLHDILFVLNYCILY